MSVFCLVLAHSGRIVKAAEIAQLLAPAAPLDHGGQTLWLDSNLGIGRLHSTPSATAGQASHPCRTPDGRLILAADVRLDARGDLMSALGIPAQGREDISDEALVLASYVRWGKDCARHLYGDFAFVIYDRHTGELFGAADALAVRRLFYAELERGVIAVASEEACLIGTPRLAERWSEVAVACWMAHAPHRQLSLFERIGVVAGGQVLMSTPGSTEVRQWWRVAPAADIRYRRMDDYAEHYRSLLQVAVSDRLPQGPVLCELSGGLDSSTVTALATAAAGPERVSALSHLYVGWGRCDESEIISATRTRLGLHNWRGVIRTPALRSPWDEAAPRDASPYLFWVSDQEQTIGEAVARGCATILCGLGGDEHTQGHRGFSVAARLARGDFESVRELFAAGRRRGKPALAYALKHLRGAIARRWLPARVISDIDARRLVHRSGVPWLLRSRDRLEQIVDQHRRDAVLAGPDPYHRHILLMLRCGSGLALLDAHRWGARERGVDVLAPLYDLRLTNFVLATPPDLWDRNGRGKFLVRRALRGYLPEQVLDADKVICVEVAKQRWAAYREAMLAEIQLARSQADRDQQLSGLLPDPETDLRNSDGFTLFYTASLARWSNNRIRNERGLK